MKKILLAFVCVALAANVAWAEGTPKKPSVKGFVSNGFWDNWELSVGAGVGTALTTAPDMGDLGDRLGFEGNFSITKWVHPIAGVRLQLQGGWFNNVVPDMGKQEWPYMFVHADFMLNFSNWVGGYRDDRAYYAVPFVGFGYMATNFTDEAQRRIGTDTNHEFAAAFGLLNKFRLSPSFDFNIELKGLLSHPNVSSIGMPGRFLFGFAATAGFTYRFNQRDWQRGVAGYTADDIRAFQAAVAAGEDALACAQNENDRLNKELCDAKNAAAKAKADADAANARAAAAAKAAKEVDPATIILYDYSMSKLTAKDKTRLELTAEMIKKGPKDRVYTIQGHADQQTGSKAGNKIVAEKRAKNVYDFLIKCGVDAKQLTYEGLGDSANPYSIQKANRAAIIK